MNRPQFYRFHQGEKILPFSDAEYEQRLAGLRKSMAHRGVDACVFTSMHNISYYSGFLYCAFGRPLMRRSRGGVDMVTTSHIPIGSATITGLRSNPSRARGA